MLGSNRDLEGVPGLELLVGLAFDLHRNLTLQHVGRLKAWMDVPAGAHTWCDCRSRGYGLVSFRKLRRLHDLARDTLRLCRNWRYDRGEERYEGDFAVDHDRDSNGAQQVTAVRFHCRTISIVAETSAAGVGEREQYRSRHDRSRATNVSNAFVESRRKRADRSKPYHNLCCAITRSD